nr:hypothetical protein [Rhodococcus sp. (in: high G+C Gram-positive bacteria)]
MIEWRVWLIRVIRNARAAQNFSGPPVELFAVDSSGKKVDSGLDARALIAMDAGAALFLSIIGVEDDTDDVHARIGELLARSIDRS